MIELNRLKIVFAEKKISNKEVAELLKVENETVSRWVNNKQQPSILTLNKIAEYLKIDIRDLLHPSEWSKNR